MSTSLAVKGDKLQKSLHVQPNETGKTAMPTDHTEKKGLATQRPMVVTVDGDVTPISQATDDVTIDEADKKLEAMGYTPVCIPATYYYSSFPAACSSVIDTTKVFKREFSTWSSFSFAMSISGVYGSLMSTWIYGLQAGGAAAIMWSWVIGGAGAWALALSLAELSSAYPSSGAMYFTLKFLAPEDQVPILCWMTGEFQPAMTASNNV